jgi:hypothetical protein
VHRTSKKPTCKRRNFYFLALCKACSKSASATSLNASDWEFSAVPPCPGMQLPPCGAAAATAAAATVECFCCCADTVAPLSCPAGHHLCEACTNRTLADFDFGARNAYLICFGLTTVDINMMPFVCQKCAEDNRVAGFFPAAACLKFCSQSTINSLFSKLRKFQLSNGGPELPAVQSAPTDASETATVIEMLRHFFDPPKCPSCRTPFAHDGGCMSMTCKGRPGMLCKAKFCLWCVHVLLPIHAIHFILSQVHENPTNSQIDGAKPYFQQPRP